MPELSHVLEALRRRARRWVIVRGIAAIFATGLGLALILGGLDALVRWQNATGRWVSTLAWIAAVGAVSWRYLVRPLRTPLTDLDLARVIHRQWPTQTPDLTSAVEFAGAAMSSIMGAPLLQQVTVSRAQRQLATVPWQSILIPHRVYWSAVIASLLVGLCSWLAVFRGEITRIGMTRLASPWSAVDWPRRTTLVYLNSDLQVIDQAGAPALRTGQGEPLTVYVENKTGGLPPRVLFERQVSTGAVEQGELRQTTLRDAAGRPHEVAVANLPTTEPFQFRALGGDDERAPWMTVNVVPPPRVQSFEITLTPPEYTGRPPEIMTSGVGHLQGLVGSQVRIRARAAAPLQSALLNRGNEPRKPLTLENNGTEFSLEWNLTAAERSTYWLDLADPFGLRASNPPRYEIRGVADQSPVASLLVPASDLRVTAQAVIPIEGEARDDIGLQRVELVYELPVVSPTGDLSTEQRSILLSVDPVGANIQPVKTTWDLTELALPVGAQVRFWLQGTDACDLHGSPGQVGRSAVRVVSVLSPEDKQQELSGKQIQLAERIIELREKQAQTEQLTREIRDQWKSVGSLRPADAVDLERAQAQQRELNQELGTAPRGVLHELQSLQREREQNRILNPEIDVVLQHWDDTLTPLASDVLPQVDEQLKVALQGAVPQSGRKSIPQELTTEALEKTIEGQLRSIDDLTRLSHEMTTWKRDQDLDQRFDEIATRQAALREQSLAIGQQTSAKTLPQLSTQEQADLTRAAERQNALAADVDLLASQWEEAAQAEGPGAEKSSMAGMAARLAELSVAASMRSASGDLRQNHMQAATDAQQKLIESLETLRKGLDQQRSQTARSAVEELRRSLANVEDLLERQLELRKRTEALSAPSADGQRTAESVELQRMQQEVEEQTGDIAQRLRREQRKAAAAAAQRAEDRMQEGRVSLEQEDMAQSLERQSEAVDELEDAREKLGKDLQSATQRADQERLSAVGQLVAALIERARATREETIRLEELRTSQGKWTRSQLKSLQSLSTSQLEISNSCQQASGDLGSEGVLGLCLTLATEHFGAAAKRLEERETGAQTQAEQFSGESLLEQFVASLSTGDSPPPAPDQQPPPPLPQESEEQSRTGSPLMAAEVRLLLRMQEELLARTRQLTETKVAEQPWSAEQTVERQQLRDRQKRLVETMRSMIGRQKADAREPSGEVQP